MTFVVDTHPLIWLVEDNPRLSRSAKAILTDPSSLIVVSTIVLVEVRYLYSARRINITLDELYKRILDSSNCAIYPVNEEVVQHIPESLNIHDAIITATALVYRDVIGQQVKLITKDQKIQASKLVDVLW
jgi:PIN domain nuclease of toxin-antitoxin system